MNGNGHGKGKGHGNGNGHGKGKGNEHGNGYSDDSYSGCNKVYRDAWIKPNESLKFEEYEEMKVETICKIQNFFKEMFWVKVIAIDKEKDYIIGEVLNKLIYPSIYNRGDLVLFSMNDIWKVQTPESEMNDIIATFNEMVKFYNTFKRVPNNLESILLNIDFTQNLSKSNKK
jgi:hypothetical protein